MDDVFHDFVEGNIGRLNFLREHGLAVAISQLGEVMRDAIARLKWERDEERERLEQIKDELKRRAATSKGVSLEC